MQKSTLIEYLLSEKLKVIDYDSSEKKSNRLKLIDYDKKDKHNQDHKKEDDDKQGIIRTIKNAHLLYKRQDGDGTYVELWVYNISKGIHDEFKIRNAILDGTDIETKTGASPDNKQKFELWTIGERQFIQITGLPN
jgi:hypothetical protein